MVLLRTTPGTLTRKEVHSSLQIFVLKSDHFMLSFYDLSDC